MGHALYFESKYLRVFKCVPERFSVIAWRVHDDDSIVFKAEVKLEVFCIKEMGFFASSQTFIREAPGRPNPDSRTPDTPIATLAITRFDILLGQDSQNKVAKNMETMREPDMLRYS